MHLRSWFSLYKRPLARHEGLIGARKIHCFDRKIDKILDRILKTETPFSNSNKDHHGNIEDLEQMQIDLRKNVNEMNKEANILVSEFPDAVGHINARQNKVTNAVKGLDNTLFWLKSKDK